jgi:hypothetical protein
MLHRETVGRAMREANTKKYIKTQVKMEAKMCNQHNSIAINSAQLEEHIKLTNSSTFSSSHMDEENKGKV